MGVPLPPVIEMLGASTLIPVLTSNLIAGNDDDNFEGRIRQSEC